MNTSYNHPILDTIQLLLIICAIVTGCFILLIPILIIAIATGFFD